MNIYLKKTIFQVFGEKRMLISLLVSAIIATGTFFELWLPITSKADSILLPPADFGLATIQENSVFAISNPIKTAKSARKLKMVITAYSSTPEQTDSTPFITASGSVVRDGIVANNLLPFGTKVRIPALYGNKVFVVEDRMHWKKGSYHLDIWFLDTEEAKNFGAEIVEVEILES